MTFQQRQELAQHLRAIPLERVLPLCGAQIDRYDQRKWHTSGGSALGHRRQVHELEPAAWAAAEPSTW